MRQGFRGGCAVAYTFGMRSAIFGLTAWASVLVACGSNSPASPTNSSASPANSSVSSANSSLADAGNAPGETQMGDSSLPANDSSAGSSDSSLASAESGAASDAGLPALYPNATIASLSSAQKGVLCDWWNASLGGYGTVTPCGGDVSVQNVPNQATCESFSLSFKCTITVGQVEACIEAEVPAKGCIGGLPACAPLAC